MKTLAHTTRSVSLLRSSSEGSFSVFPLKASTYVAERCNTRNKKNETSSHP